MAARNSTAASTSATPSPGNDADDRAAGNIEADENGSSNALASAEHRNGASSVQTILLDIAFLHSIATHRPIGPHKHFNIIPILINLERTARQVGARMRDDHYMRAVSADIEGNTTTTPSIKQEDEEEGNNDDSMLNAQMAPVDAKMIWDRLNEMYDVEGLEELENLAIDNDAMSPFRHAYASLLDRAYQEGQVQVPFGFGSGLDKVKKPAKSSRGSNRRGAANDEEDEIKEDFVEFELGPWEEYEGLVAPRRLKSFAPDEDDPSESDEELSEPSEIAESGVEDVGEEAEEEQEAEGAEEEEEENEEASQKEASVLGEMEEEEGDEEEVANASNKRKSSSKKSSNTASNKKTKAAAASKATRKSATPRRSSRR